MKIYGSLVLLLTLIIFSFTTDTAIGKNNKVGDLSNKRPIDHSPLTIAPIITGAEQTEKYLPLLKNKRVGILANPTSVIGKKHLVDSLMNRGIKFVKAFGPEHG